MQLVTVTMDSPAAVSIFRHSLRERLKMLGWRFALPTVFWRGQVEGSVGADDRLAPSYANFVWSDFDVTHWVEGDEGERIWRVSERLS